MNIKFDVPYNGDTALIDFYMDNSEYIEIVYGRAEDGYPQGRKTSKLKKITLEEIYCVNNKLLSKGIKFNYLLNGTSHGNKEYNKDYRDKFLNHIKNLKNNGIKIVTIGNLLLLEAAIQEIEGIEIAASITLEVDSLLKVKTICQLGVQHIFLSKVLLKNFSALVNINSYLKKNYPKIKVYLLANDPCLNQCLYTNYHNETLSLLTGDNKQCSSFCRLKCTKKFSTDIESIISASFIRPEDIEIYNDIGFNLIKLCDRKQTTEWIKRVVLAYMNMTYIGNISDIMAPWSKNNGQYPKTKIVQYEKFFQNGLDVYRDHLRFSPFINNEDLEGYLDFWIKNKPNGCTNEDCEQCGYCKQIAKKVIKNNMNVLKSNLHNAIKASLK